MQGLLAVAEANRVSKMQAVELAEEAVLPLPRRFDRRRSRYRKSERGDHWRSVFGR